MSDILLNIILLIFVVLFVVLGHRSRELNDGLYTLIFSVGIIIIIIIMTSNHWIESVTTTIIIVVNGFTHHMFKKYIERQERM